MYQIEDYSVFNKEVGLIDFQAPICARIRDLPLLNIVEVDNPSSLDLLSLRFYGTYELWWVLAIYNNITDPLNITAFVNAIKIPVFANLQQLLYEDMELSR